MKEGETKHMTFERMNLFDPKTVKRSMTITWKERLRLIFKKRHYSMDWTNGEDDTVLTTYKVMDNQIYILKVRHLGKAKRESI